MVTAEKMWQIHDHHGIPPNTPVVGAASITTSTPCSSRPIVRGISTRN